MLTPENDRRHRARLPRNAPWRATRYRPLDAAVRAAPLDDAYADPGRAPPVLAAAGRGEIRRWKIALTSKAMQPDAGSTSPRPGNLLDHGPILAGSSRPRRPIITRRRLRGGVRLAMICRDRWP
jgi:2-keto-4-pentenoate hydratase